MREPTYFLLLSLTQQPLHGYAIAQRATELSDGRVKLSAGTLYGALDRLVASQDLCVDREEVVQGRKRRYYRITTKGLGQLAEATQQLRATLSVAEPLIGPGFSGVRP